MNVRASALLTGCLACLSFGAIAQQSGPRSGPPPAAAAAPANQKVDTSDPRDFTGVWWTRGYDRTFRPMTDTPMRPADSAKRIPFPPSEQASWQHHLDMEKAGTPIADAPTQCFPHGVPRLIASPYPIEIVYSPDLITILHEVAHNVRFIHMDGKPVPADTPVSFLGYSRGHWEGNTLVIETDHFNTRTQIDEEALSHGPKLKITERITKAAGRNGVPELHDEITIDDPDHFTKPWTALRTFPRRDDVHLSEYSCEENNRNAPGEDGISVAK
jgi:hypothetical protein